MKKNLLFLYRKSVKRLLLLDRVTKNIIIILVDYLSLVISFWLSLSIRMNDIYLLNSETNVLIFFAPLLAIIIFYFFGFYESIIRYANFINLLRLMLAVSIYTLTWFIIVLISGVIEKPYDFLVINWLMTIYAIGGIRYLARWILILRDNSSINVLIYGAGNAGIQLESAMKHNAEINVLAFIDDNKQIQGRRIEGIKVYNSNQIAKIISTKGISEILIAMPSIPRKKVHSILQSLKKYPVIIRILPGLSDLAKGNVSVSDLKKIKIEDLLRRHIVKPDPKLLTRDTEGKNVLVTGAGGSIGSELCRQIIKLNPNSLILFEISEAALYLIERELIELNSGIKILAMIGNVTRKNRLEYILKNYSVDTIYHTAAYKHVPLVEKNTIPGIRCNIFGTLTCFKAAINSNVTSFVFISTDKAVRPTNIMGATKRFAELILQAYSQRSEMNLNNEPIRISMVRFGNVLGSSGSIVPLFRSQIKKGGPLTVTDPNIIRYFMTIEEASQLVIQAGSMGSKGEIFLLDMGKPVSILNLAKDMIRLSGMTIKDHKNPDGDIEILFTGLRPGEKLYEELLIGEKADPTDHDKIMKANEEDIKYEDLNKYLSELELAIEESDFKKITEIFIETISGYNPGNKIFNQ